MGRSFSYERIIGSIEKSRLSGEEKKMLKEAVGEVFTRHAIAANGIAALVRITADEDALRQLKGIVSRARGRAAEGKVPLSKADSEKLRKCVSHLNEESVNRIVGNLERGNYLLFTMLEGKLNEIDVHEIEKLQRIAEKI